MAKISKLTLPVTNESTGQVTSQTFDIGGKEYIAGYGIDVAANDEISAATFVGTQAEWDALTPTAQGKFDTVNITDDFNGSNEIEVAYIERVPVSDIKDTIYGLINYNYGSDEAADGFLDDVGLFVKTPGTASDYTYTSDSAEVSLDGIHYSEFESLTWDGIEFKLAYADREAVTVEVGDEFYWRTQTNVSYFAGREKNQTMNPLGGSGAGGSVIRVLTEDASLYGRTVIASGSLFSNSAVFSNTGEAIIEAVLETGNITVHLDNGIRTKDYQMTLDSYSYYELNVMMAFDYVQWLEKADIDPTEYSSLEDVFDDEEVVRELMLKHASADFLAFNVSANLGDFDLFTVNETAMKWIGLSDYLVDKLVEIEGAEAKLLASEYWKRYLKDSVPIMGSNTAPYGTVGYSTSDSRSPYPYYVFDDTDHGTDYKESWMATAYVNSRLYYKFDSPTNVQKYRYRQSTTSLASSVYGIGTYKIQYSDDGTNWTDATQSLNAVYDFEYHTESLQSAGYHLYWAIFVIGSSNTSAFYCGVNKLQFYGRSLDVSVPSMTSNTSPYGEVIGAGNIYNGSLSDLYQPFSTTAPSWLFGPDFSNAYIGYEFKSSTIVKKASYVTRLNDYEILTYKVQALNNNNVWEDIPIVPESEVRVEIGTYKSKQNAVRYTFDLDNHKNYWRYRFVPLTSGTSGGQAANTYANIIELKFYGISYSEKEFEAGSTCKWLYDHGVFLDNNSLDSTNYTYHSGNYGTAGTVTDFDDGTGFRILCTGTGSYYQKSAGLNNLVNVSNYSLLFMKNSMGGFIYPNTVLDVTSVNNQAYIGFSSVNNSGNNTVLMAVASSKATMYNNAYAVYIPSGPSNIIIDVTELWLE